MKTQFLFIPLVIGVIILTAFITNKKSKTPEYALMTLSIHGGTYDKENNISVIYENGQKENLTQTLGLKISGYDDDFPERVKVFKYLNEKGYKFQSHSYGEIQYNQYLQYRFQSYIFIKE